MNTSVNKKEYTPHSLSIDDLMAASKMLNEMQVISPPQMQIMISDLACERNEFNQFMFPKSKKKRIRKKWSKQNKNFRFEITQHFVHDQVNNIIYVSSKTFDLIKNSENAKEYCNFSML